MRRLRQKEEATAKESKVFDVSSFCIVVSYFCSARRKSEITPKGKLAAFRSFAAIRSRVSGLLHLIMRRYQHRPISLAHLVRYTSFTCDGRNGWAKGIWWWNAKSHYNPLKPRNISQCKCFEEENQPAVCCRVYYPPTLKVRSRLVGIVSNHV